VSYADKYVRMFKQIKKKCHIQLWLQIAMHNCTLLFPVFNYNIKFDLGYFCLAEELLASEEGFCSLQSVYLFIYEENNVANK